MLRILLLISLIVTALIGQAPPDSLNHLQSLSVPFKVDSTGSRTDSSTAVLVKPQKPKPFSLHPLRRYFLTDFTNPADTVFSFSQIKNTIYNGFADLFRQQSDFQIYDFYEMGQPRYVAPLHLWPQQSGVFYEGHLLNDPLNGMYNLRFISADAVGSVQASSQGYINSSYSAHAHNSIQINGRIQNPEYPYTRIMFRQGDFGYTDLDIQFARRLNDRASIQLGGLNKLNDINHLHGVIYRAALNFQPQPNLFSRSQYLFNDEKLRMLNYNTGQEFTYSEEREQFYQDLIFTLDPAKGERLHFQADLSGTQRSNYSAIDSFHIKYRFKQAHFAVARNLVRGPFTGSGGVSYDQSQFWGNALDNDYNLSSFGGFLSADYTGLDSLHFTPAVHWQQIWQDKPLLSPSFSIAYGPTKNLHLSLSADQLKRQPTANELYFEYGNLSGNSRLQAEIISSAVASAGVNLLDRFQLNFNGGYRYLENEILFASDTFINGSKRSFGYLSGKAALNLHMFRFSAGGQLSSGKKIIGPEHSGWIQINYHDRWLKGALIIDAVGNAHYFGPQNQMQYNPQVERFFSSSGKFDAYLTFSYKIVATVKSAQLYVAMDNTFSSQYSVVQGYPELYRRVRFGLNWVLWE